MPRLACGLSLLVCGAALAEGPLASSAEDNAVVSGTHLWSDAERVGQNRQPRWTEQRSFPGPRVYVAPLGTRTVEFWLEEGVPFDGSAPRLQSGYALSIGLPFRVQLAVSLQLEHTTAQPVNLGAVGAEVRWALAKWDVIPWNPTLYLKWVQPTLGPQRLEARLLLGSNITDRWYWGGNFFWERELWGTNLTNVYGLTGSVSYSLRERSLSVGGGYRIEVVDLRDERFRARALKFLVGPTLSLRPLERLQVLIGVFGGPGLERKDVTGPFRARPALQSTLVAGWEF